MNCGNDGSTTTTISDKRYLMSDIGYRLSDIVVRAAIAGSILLLAACAQVGSAPDIPAAIELSALPSPSVVVGDTLRSIDGVVAPVRAIVRNLSGDVITGSNVRYLYADYLRDTALAVDSLTGIVRAIKAATGEARLAARVGGALQVLKAVAVTTRPDSADRVGLNTTLFTTVLADTGRSGAASNTSPSLSLTIRHNDAVGVTSGVNAWPVKFEVLSPANATNDTTKSVWMVDDQGRASVLDTTDVTGVAARKIRIRAALFPAAGVVDSVIVRATVTYKGVTLKGAPVRIAVPVKRGS